MRAEPRLRPATVRDADAVAALHAASWRRTYRGVFDDAFLHGPVDDERRDVWRRRLAEASGAPGRASEGLATCVAFVAGLGGAPDDAPLVGFVAAYARGDAGFGLFVDNLHVAAAHEGRGLGTRLLARAAAWARETGVGGAPYLWVAEANLRAQRFYLARGGTLAEGTWLPNPGGGRGRYLRCVWRSAEALADGCV